MGAKRVKFFLNDLCLRFNPRTRDGCEELAQKAIKWATVSIHAPVMGANDKFVKAGTRFQFQSTHP